FLPGRDRAKEAVDVQAQGGRRPGLQVAAGLGEGAAGAFSASEAVDLVEGGGDLDEPLEEGLRLGGGGAPDLLPGLVGGEEVAAVELIDPFPQQTAALVRGEDRMEAHAWRGGPAVRSSAVRSRSGLRSVSNRSKGRLSPGCTRWHRLRRRRSSTSESWQKVSTALGSSCWPATRRSSVRAVWWPHARRYGRSEVRAS